MAERQTNTTHNQRTKEREKREKQGQKEKETERREKERQTEKVVTKGLGCSLSIQHS